MPSPDRRQAPATPRLDKRMADDAATARALRSVWSTQNADIGRLLAGCERALALAAQAQDARGEVWTRLARVLFGYRDRTLADSLADLDQVNALLPALAPQPRAQRLADIAALILLMPAGRHAEAIDGFDALPLLGDPGLDDPDDAFVLHGRGTCAAVLGRLDASFDAYYANLLLTERTGPPVRHAFAVGSLAALLGANGLPQQGIALIEALLREHGVPGANLVLSTSLRANLAAMHHEAGQSDLARQGLRQLMAEGAPAALPAFAFNLHETLAAACLALGLTDEARPHVAAAYAAAGNGNVAWLGACHAIAGQLAAADGELAEAIHLLGLALDAFDRGPDLFICAATRDNASRLLAQCHAATGDYRAAYEADQRFFHLQQRRHEHLMKTQQAMSQGQQHAGDSVQLSARELDCLAWCAQGRTAREIGRLLGLSEWTVAYHLERAKRKFGLAHKHQVIARAVSLGLVRLPAAAAAAAADLAP